VIVLDTTVLAYAVGESHPLREPCRRLLAAHSEGRLEATTTIEVLQEFAHIRAQRRSREDAVTLTSHYLAALGALTTTHTDLERGLKLFGRHSEIGAFDAVLAAVALERGADALVSADRGFAVIPELRWIDPASADIEQLIGDR
jgi:uncharacterized protein